MSRNIDISYQGRASRFCLTPVDRKRLHGFKRRIALDENGDECTTAHLTRDGRFLLGADCTADLYINDDGDTINRSELVTVDAGVKPLPTLPATSGCTQEIEAPGELGDFLSHVVTKVYALEGELLDPTLEQALRDGAIFRVPYRPRPTHTETPAFLLANENGVFLMQAEICNFDFVGLGQEVSEEKWADETNDEFDFDLEWEADHAAS